MLLSCFRNEEVRAELKRIDAQVSSGRTFDALKAIRSLYPAEEAGILSNNEIHTRSRQGTPKGNRTMVTAVSSTSTTSTTSTSSSTAANDAASASLDYDSFLQLLIAQMQNQDPTDPMDARASRSRSSRPSRRSSRASKPTATWKP